MSMPARLRDIAPPALMAVVLMLASLATSNAHVRRSHPIWRRHAPAFHHPIRRRRVIVRRRILHHPRPHHPAPHRRRAVRAKTRHIVRHAVRRRHVDVARRLKPLIVIDPGHGGRDPGAIGAQGTLEKRVTLATALELRRVLLATHRYRVALTRTRDRFVSLASRVAFARTHHAALFIAIHADFSVDRRMHGASVYTRSEGPEQPKVTQIIAGTGSASIADSLARADADARLQYAMIEHLTGDVSLMPDPSREAQFYVLGAAGLPSVLLETGFLSNHHDELLLRSPHYRWMIACAVRDAIDDFFRDRQPAKRSAT